MSWIEILIARNLIITLHDGRAPFLDRLDERIKSDATVGKLTAASFLRSLLDAVVTTYFEAVDRIEDEVDELDTRSLMARPDEDILPELVDVRRKIARLRRLLSDHREVYAALADADVSEIADPDDEGFAAVAARFEDAIHSVEDSRDLLLGSFDVFMSRLSQRTNDAMKILALATVLLLPGSLDRRTARHERRGPAVQGRSIQLLDRGRRHRGDGGARARHRLAEPLDPVRATRPAMTVAVPEDVAREAGLRYAHDDRPGITRRRAGTGFSYRDRDGATIRDRATLARIRGLAIPPAWTEVWICPDPRGHIQATGRDASGRKQHRYHARWRRRRDESKFDRMVAFAEALPAIRARCDADLARRGLPREKVLAAVVRLLELTLIRVGNDEYARLNRSFGLTTMRGRHVRVDGSAIRFRFPGKSGKRHDVGLRDRRLAAIVRRCQDLPGQDLFQYLDGEGAVHDVTSDDVNGYLRDITGGDFTAKDFRTWAGTVLAFRALSALRPPEGDADARHEIAAAMRTTAERLGNTPAVARDSYVHPAVIDAYLDGSIGDALVTATEDAGELRRPRPMRRPMRWWTWSASGWPPMRSEPSRRPPAARDHADRGRANPNSAPVPSRGPAHVRPPIAVARRLATCRRRPAPARWAAVRGRSRGWMASASSSALPSWRLPSRTRTTTSSAVWFTITSTVPPMGA